jgi:hypothetical protein
VQLPNNSFGSGLLAFVSRIMTPPIAQIGYDVADPSSVEPDHSDP